MRKLDFVAFVLCCALVCGCQRAEVAAPAAVDAGAGAVEWTELLPNARRPLDGVVSGGQPTAGQLAQAAAAGYRTVINLRTPGERGADDEPTQVERLGMEYVALPIDGADGITETNARELARLLEEAERPILLHCGSGNRVGALLALSSYHVDGKPAEEALQYGLESGLTRLEPVVREHLEKKGPKRGQVPNPAHESEVDHRPEGWIRYLSPLFPVPL